MSVHFISVNFTCGMASCTLSDDNGKLQKEMQPSPDKQDKVHSVV